MTAAATWTAGSASSLPDRLEPSVVHVWRGSLDQDAAVRHALEPLLSSDERERAAAFRFDRHRHRYVVGRGLLRSLLGRYLGADPRSLVFAYGDRQKPTLADGPFFNLAHADATVLYAFSSSFEVGVDVEHVQPALDGLELAERFFSVRERETLRTLDGDRRAGAFLACWTRKEAFVKARGDGLALDLASFDVTLAPGDPVALVRTGWAAEERRAWQLVDLSDPERGQVAALAARSTGWNYVCRDVDVARIVCK